MTRPSASVVVVKTLPECEHHVPLASALSLHSISKTIHMCTPASCQYIFLAGHGVTCCRQICQLISCCCSCLDTISSQALKINIWCIRITSHVGRLCQTTKLVVDAANPIHIQLYGNRTFLQTTAICSNFS